MNRQFSSDPLPEGPSQSNPGKRASYVLIAILWLVCPVAFYLPLAGLEFYDSDEGALEMAGGVMFDLRDQKAAAALYLEKHPLPPSGENHAMLLAPYVKYSERFLSSVRFYTFRVTDEAAWVGCRIPRYPDVRERLTSRASRIQIYGSTRLDSPPVSDDAAHLYRDEAIVWMRVK